MKNSKTHVEDGKRVEKRRFNFPFIRTFDQKKTHLGRSDGDESHAFE